MADEVRTEKKPDEIIREIEANVQTRVAEAVEKSVMEKVAPQIRALVDEIRPHVAVVGPASEYRAIKEAMIQKRAVTLNGSGAYKVVRDMIEVIVKRYDLLSKFRYEYGAGAQTNIPVLSARPAKPTKQSEGATSITSDATAAVGATTITPYAYVSVLPISAEALLQGAADIESRLPQIFGDSFADAMLYGAITGDSTMTGLFADASLTNDILCASAGAPVWADLLNLAGTVKGYAFNPLIIINPTFVGNLLAASVTSAEALKTELLMKNSIRGIPIAESSYAPTTTTAGSEVAVALDPANYVIAIASELNIIPIRKVGDTNTYFQAEAYFNGKPILAANGWQLETI